MIAMTNSTSESDLTTLFIDSSCCNEETQIACCLELSEVGTDLINISLSGHKG
jgi:hypothetical protein